MIKKFTLIICTFLFFFSGSVKAAKTICLFSGSQTVTSSKWSLDNSRLSILEAGDEITVTFSSYTGVTATMQIDWAGGQYNADISSGTLSYTVTSDDISRIASPIYGGGLNFKYGDKNTVDFTISDISVSKNDNYYDTKDILTGENRIYPVNSMCFSDGDYLLVTMSDAQGFNGYIQVTNGGWPMVEGSSTNISNTNQYAYKLQTGNATSMQTYGWNVTLQAGAPNSISKISIIKKKSNYYTFSENYEPKFTQMETSDPINVTLKRPFVTGWNSICLPFETTVSNLGGTKLYEYSDKTKDGDDVVVVFSEVTGGTLTAGKPYIIKFDNNVESVNLSSVTITKETVNWDGNFGGTYSTIGAGYATGLFGIKASEGVFHKVSSTGSIKGYRAYFYSTFLDDGVARARGMFVDNNGTTSIMDIKEVNDSNNDIYTLQGIKVQGQPRKGNIYIKNGKKVIY